MMKCALDQFKKDLLGIREKLAAEYRAKLDDLLQQIDRQEAGHLRETLNLIYRTRNLIRLTLAGVDPKSEAYQCIANDELSNVEALPNVDQSSIDSLAKQLFTSSRAKTGDIIVLMGKKRNMQIIKAVARLCIESGIHFMLDIEDTVIDRALLDHAGDGGVARLATDKVAFHENPPIRIKVNSNPDPSIPVDPKRAEEYRGLTEAALWEPFQSGVKHYCLAMIPTPQDAESDGVSYEECLRVFFEACDQPWEEIKVAQAQLIEKLNAGKSLHITNDDGTDLRMNIEGQTFINSTILKNIPGSEVFSSPIKTGVDGKLVARGKFQYQDYGVIEDIELEFQQGRIVSYKARVGQKILERIITADDEKGEGSRFLGEIAFGTNPHLRKHLINSILTEKVGGSFHVAIGGAYELPNYDGEKVHVDNGNRSDAGTHWDITTMLRNRGGRVELDGTLIQVNGEWISRTCNVLNQGWGALPSKRQPSWWKQRYPQGYSFCK